MSSSWVEKRLDIAIFLTVALLLLAILVVFAVSLWFQYVNYREGIRMALNDPAGPDHWNVIAYARSLDFAVLKTSGLFMSLLLAFAGGLYVLRAGEARFKLVAGHSDMKGSLSTSSPGLVMVVAAVVLAIVVISHRTIVSKVPSSEAAEDGVWVESAGEEGRRVTSPPTERAISPPTEADDLGFQTESTEQEQPR